MRKLLILDKEEEKEYFVPVFQLKDFEVDRMTKITRLFGRLIAYLPQSRRAYYAWALTFAYRPTQHISVYQLSPAHVRITFFARWEIGAITQHGWLGLRLGQPLIWFRRLRSGE